MVKKQAKIEKVNNLKDFKVNSKTTLDEVIAYLLFDGNLEEAKAFIDLGFLLSFTGAITYPPRKDGKGCNYEEIIKNIPLDKIHAETDSPFVAPVPYRGKRNEPTYVIEVIKKVEAQLTMHDYEGF